MSFNRQPAGRHFPGSRLLIIASVVLAIGILAWGVRSTIQAKAAMQVPANTPDTSQLGAKRPVPLLPYVYSYVANPAQTVVTDQKGVWLATFTNGAYTVRLAGVQRTFAEPSTTKATVSHDTWVRVLPKPFAGTVDEPWLTMELANTSPDILAAAMQYISNAPAIMSDGIQIAGDAAYGPLMASGMDSKVASGQTGGSRKAGADFNDYLAIDWHYGTKVDRPEPTQDKSMDCSGYIRMVWGYRAGLPLAPAVSGTATTGSLTALPRRAAQQQNASPGIELIANKGTQVTDFSNLAIGDIVFFDANKSDSTQIDHVGMFLGSDSTGHYRFISSRQTANGPTMGDVGGKSILDGSGHYGSAFRAARRF